MFPDFPRATLEYFILDKYHTAIQHTAIQHTAIQHKASQHTAIQHTDILSYNFSAFVVTHFCSNKNSRKMLA
jgi:hypothetical protein